MNLCWSGNWESSAQPNQRNAPGNGPLAVLSLHVICARLCKTIADHWSNPFSVGLTRHWTPKATLASLSQIARALATYRDRHVTATPHAAFHMITILVNLSEN